MEPFSGFTAGRISHTALPDVFFSELLPTIDDLSELKVILHCFWQIRKQRGALRFLTRRAMSADTTLRRSLGEAGLPFEEHLDQALARAVNRGVLLALTLARDGDAEDCFFLNTQEGRRAVARIQRGDELPWESARAMSATASGEDAAHQARPNIFVLYEQTVGLLQPIIAEELRDAEQSYPPEWIEEAFRIAAERNVRHWRYVRAILQRWSAEGKTDGAAQDRNRYIRGPYADYIEH